MKTALSGGKNAALAKAPAKQTTPDSSRGLAYGHGVERQFRETPYGWLVLAVVWLASMVYLGLHVKAGWVPHDAGMLGESAERVLRGQVPYRDFEEIYTGGLTYLNALAFGLFGANLFSLRIPLFLFFLGWVPAIYSIARRFATPLAAGAATLLAVAWSVPNYPEAVPSWYNLFFATWGVLALIQFLETDRRRWLWIAGLCGGLSFLVKITALYFIAAVLLFFAFRESSVARRTRRETAQTALPYRIFASGCLLLFLLVLLQLIMKRPTGGNFFYFVLPSACLVVLLLREVWRAPSPGSWLRFGRLFSMALPFLGGALLPVALFLAYYAKVGATKAWFSGILGAGVRVHWAAVNPLSPLLIIGLAPMALFLSLAYIPGSARGPRAGIAALAVLSIALVLARAHITVYAALGLSLPVLVPLLALAVVIRLYRSESLSELERQMFFLLAAATVVCALIQFPFATPVYFTYVAPLVVLLIACLLSSIGKPDRKALAALLIFYLAFAVWLRMPAYYMAMQTVPLQRPSLQTLSLSRAGGIRVLGEEAREYESVVRLVQAHAHGKYIYAGPDCPEIYFLSGLRNPTRTLFAFLDSDFQDPARRTQRIFQVLKRDNINLVVLKNNSEFSGPLPAQLHDALPERYPRSAKIGNFEVRWK